MEAPDGAEVPDLGFLGAKGKPPKLDRLSQLYQFRLAYRRDPDSWKDFVYGMNEIVRHNARQALSAARAFSASQAADAKERERWFAVQEAIGGGRG